MHLHAEARLSEPGEHLEQWVAHEVMNRPGVAGEAEAPPLEHGRAQGHQRVNRVRARGDVHAVPVADRDLEVLQAIAIDRRDGVFPDEAAPGGSETRA